jgi:hypothetical protein
MLQTERDTRQPTNHFTNKANDKYFFHKKKVMVNARLPSYKPQEIALTSFHG